ncbi:S-adenosyl-l-methionine hydroxide adenosyltransferase family protein [Elizabethkingia sp. JS20170427COW]|uniref:SAM hydrolase/SAM-dependent halogenase family protein n=1 Tax=Elizabethkingia sp. JS20170427COW TaxID=2583851 RepID=UPI001110D360|nr:SAM-dependent chlorinase/fluorinase [Elizabethkingia sp. JS20170427COW]QCX52309.1 SAM-dependent chlorinase/fluorinase [Elizabethkingia sp. JS20170427COW]
MALITLTTDYGTLDYRVAAIKGSIYSQLPDAQIVDITHDIQAYNLLQASYIIKSAYKYFPEGSVHILGIDCFHHEARKNILAKVDGHFFICADNGLLSLIFHDIQPEYIYKITLTPPFGKEINFTPTDIFAPVAAHLAKGGLPQVVGNKIKNIKENKIPRAVFNETEGILVGEIIYIDNFGNAVSNISKKFFEEKLVGYEGFDIKFRSFILGKIGNSYTSIITNWDNEEDQHGNASAIFNEHDLIEITIYKGSINNGAHSLLGLSVGDRVFVEYQKKREAKS